MTVVAETFVTPSSSNIATIGFDPETDTLSVEFRDGQSYDYFNVSPSTYRSFTQAGSHGSFFHRQIKGRYAYDGPK